MCVLGRFSGGYYRVPVHDRDFSATTEISAYTGGVVRDGSPLIFRHPRRVGMGKQLLIGEHEAQHAPIDRALVFRPLVR